MKVYRKKSGRGKLLSEPLRKLPGELVTNDLADPDKAHELDAPHVVDQILEDNLNKESEKPKKPRRQCAQPGERRKLDQWEIDCVRMRVLSSIVNLAVKSAQKGHAWDLSVRHLWFPENEVNIYQVRDGNPPADRDRPKHLRGYRLEVDPLSPPQAMLDLMAENGIEWVDFRHVLGGLERDDSRIVGIR